MNYLIIILGIVTAAIWLPIVASFTAEMLYRKTSTSFNPNAQLYFILGLLIGLMIALGVIQANIGLLGLLIVPGIVLGLPLITFLLLAAWAAFVALCFLATEFCDHVFGSLCRAGETLIERVGVWCQKTGKRLAHRCGR